MIEINTDPESGRDKLRAALLELHRFAPLLAEDPATLELRTMAELALARAELAKGDRYAASRTIDQTLESLGDIPVATERLGPSLGALVEERREVLMARGLARLRVECSVACRVFVDERHAGDVDGPGSARELALPLGSHRVWVEAIDDHNEGLEPRRSSISLDSADERLTLTYPEAAPAPALDLSRGDRRRFKRGPAWIRVAPRWVEATTFVVGTAAVVAGAVLLAIDSRCPRGVDPRDTAACPKVYDTRTAGIGLVSAGAAGGLIGGVMLIVDEARVGDRRGHELGLTWTVSF
ncbi:hypothetical protein [Enhygromyxa salina]|nr:hypothetical protein [Enhygromyxa salina]